jgi:hypothetical protein
MSATIEIVVKHTAISMIPTNEHLSLRTWTDLSKQNNTYGQYYKTFLVTIYATGGVLPYDFD